MTCVPNDPRFRLLDWLVGWDAAPDGWIGLAGADDPSGLRLAGHGPALTSEQLDPYIQPPPLSAGCGPCDWVLATLPAPDSRTLLLGPCDNQWRQAWIGGCAALRFERAVAVAVDRHRIAIADSELQRVCILRLKSGQVIGEAQVENPVDAAFGPRGDLFVASQGGTAIIVLSGRGRRLGAWPGNLPQGRIERLAFDRNGRLWLVVDSEGRRSLFVQRYQRDSTFEAGTYAALTEAFDRSALQRSSSLGFCLNQGCFDWYGRPIASDLISTRPVAEFARQGQLLTTAIDSGIPRCRWHRVMIDATVPDGTSLSLAVSTSEVKTPTAQGANTPPWDGFPGGIPHPSDWQQIGAGLLDALIEQPAGRYIFVRLRLSGDGTATPRVRRIHLDFPRATSADLLPAVYHDDATGGAFTERFLGLFDASLDTVSETVRRFPALLDAHRAPADVLPWIANFLAVALDEGWSSETRRRILSGAAALFRQRGTLPGLESAIRLAYFPNTDDDAAAIVEHGRGRAWGSVTSTQGTPGSAAARLGSTRLFGRAQARLTLGRSAIGRTPLMSFGDPGDDPHRAGAFRFTVTVPPAAGVTRESVARLIDGQKPAHTIADIRIGGDREFILGTGARLGIDTLLRRPSPMAFGNPQLRLRRGTILAGQRPTGAVLGMHPLTPPPSCWSDAR